jgi:hypothetical protein
MWRSGIGLGIAGCVAMAMVGVAAGGFWNPQSKHHWREYAQTSMLTLADVLPDVPAAASAIHRLTTSAVALSPSRVSTAEFERVARLLESAGQRAEAAEVWLGLTWVAGSAGLVRDAEIYAERALRNDTSEHILQRLDMLTGPEDVAQPFAFAELRRTALLTRARWTPRAEATDVAVDAAARAALSAHGEAWTRAELELAGQLFLRADRPHRAAMLWLAIADHGVFAGDHATARDYAERAFRIEPSETAVLTLLTLAPDDATQRRWFAELRSRFPQHELVEAESCLLAFTSFASDPPEVCAAVSWVAEHANHGRREEVRLAGEIADLPRKAAAILAEEQARLRAAEELQPKIQQALQFLGDRRPNAGWRALGRFIIGSIPFLKPMSITLEERVALEAICLAEYFRIGCAMHEAAEAWQGMKQEVAQIDEWMARLREMSAANDRTASSARLQIYRWRSREPLDELESERGRLLERFQQDVLDEGRRRFNRYGVPPADAVRAIVQPQFAASVK